MTIGAAQAPQGETNGTLHPPQPALAGVGRNAVDAAADAANATKSAEKPKREPKRDMCSHPLAGDNFRRTERTDRSLVKLTGGFVALKQRPKFTLRSTVNASSPAHLQGKWNQEESIFRKSMPSRKRGWPPVFRPKMRQRKNARAVLLGSM
ncbi:MAG TPA: hypothetical protein VG291_11420 [Xanthobacteraceae bacterium]|nr:hypothetical protein [Xanthobacteraceae bacterium]